MTSRRLAFACALVLGLACGGDDATSGDADTGQVATSAQDTGVECGPMSIPGCAMPVEVCEGGQCSCLCADPVTTGATAGDGTGDTAGASGGMCTDEVVGADSPPVCDSPSQVCETIGGCCRCDTYDGCGDDPVWMCVEIVPDPSCPGDVPAIDSPCTNDGVVCRLCDADGPVVRTCAGGMWNEGFFSCV